MNIALKLSTRTSPNYSWLLGIKMTSRKSLFIFAVVSSLAACSEKNFPESGIYTLYSSTYPTDIGRNGVATFDLANTPELSMQICQETADLFQTDFEKRKQESGWSANTKMRHWCEKGRFKK